MLVWPRIFWLVNTNFDYWNSSWILSAPSSLRGLPAAGSLPSPRASLFEIQNIAFKPFKTCWDTLYIDVYSLLYLVDGIVHP